MTKTHFISDLHLGHSNIALKFTKSNGDPARINPKTGERFSSVKEMDEYIIASWNSVVSAKDRVYVLGDLVMNRRNLETVQRLNGRICLIKGNHDLFRLKDYLERCPNIDKYEGVVMMPKLGWVLTHIPVHERQLRGIWTHNIHGHLHTERVQKFVVYNRGPNDPPGNMFLDDERYFNVSCEQLDYVPIELEQLKVRLENEH